jgi:uncharacterized protein (TIGR02594 family)
MKSTELVASAKREIGTCEYPANSNRVKYNTWMYGQEVYGDKYPWCAAFVSWLFRDEQRLCKKTASCADMLSWFEKKGQIVKDPHPGDIVFFKFSTNNRRTNHVGIVESVDKKAIFTIEGNTSLTSNDNGGKVMLRKRTGGFVAFARPSYTDIPVKSVTVIAREVIAGMWGAGNDRRQRLTRAGFRYQEVQDEVNRILKG